MLSHRNGDNILSYHMNRGESEANEKRESRARGRAQTSASCSPRFRLCTHLKLSEARSQMEDVPTLTPYACGSPKLLLVLFALRVPSSSVNAFLKIDVVLAKRS